MVISDGASSGSQHEVWGISGEVLVYMCVYHCIRHQIKKLIHNNHEWIKIIRSSISAVRVRVRPGC